MRSTVKQALCLLACESRRISGCRLSPPKQATAGNTSAFAGYVLIVLFKNVFLDFFRDALLEKISILK